MPSPLLAEMCTCSCCYCYWQQESSLPRTDTHLSGLPEDVHILVLPGVDVLAQEPQQLRQACLASGPG